MAPILTTPESSELSLPASGWDLHIGRGSRAETAGWRPALEVHTGDGLIDVAVAGGLDHTLLRGALRGRRDGQRWAVAWGHLPENAHPDTSLVVEFRTRRTSQQVTATSIAGSFWVAEAPGGFRSVAVTTGPERAAARLRRYRPSH